MKPIIYIYVNILLLIIIAPAAYAQKLPNVQQLGLRAPAKLKIDGKADEWNNTFQAYNKSTQIFYTMTNDKNNLYLVVQVTDPSIIRKMVIGGVTLTINTSAKKKDKNNVSVTFPVYDKKYPPFYPVLNNRPVPTNDTAKNRMQADSFMNVYNLQITNKLKIIGVIGIKGIEDSVVSVYNEYGIKAAALFDNKINYTCELAIPLKYLKIADGQQKFNYNIMLNGTTVNAISVQIVQTSHGDRTIFTGGNGVNYSGSSNQIDFPTDFWGEYTLVK